MNISVYWLPFLLGIAHISSVYRSEAAGPPRPLSQKGLWALSASITVVKGYYNGLSFPDAKHGWIVGNLGQILHTDDGGATWEQQANPLTNRLTCVEFASAEVGWTVGQGSTVLSTRDGGRHWKANQLPDYGAVRPTGMALHFVNDHEGWIAHNYGGLLHTLDGGQTWTAQERLVAGAFVSMCFLDAKTGWVLSVDGTLLKTTDGGQSWTSQKLSATPYATAIFTTVSFLDAAHGWLGTDTTCSSRLEDTPPLFRTSDGGNTWSVEGRWPSSSPRVIRFQDAQSGWCGDLNGIYSTTDGGLSWLKELDSNGDPFVGMAFAGNSRRWVLSFTGKVYTNSP